MIYRLLPLLLYLSCSINDLKPIDNIPTSEQSLSALLDALNVKLKKDDYEKGFSHQCGSDGKVTVRDVLVKFFSELESENYDYSTKISCKEGYLPVSWHCGYNIVTTDKADKEFISNRDFNFHISKVTGELIKGSLICGQSY